MNAVVGVVEGLHRGPVDPHEFEAALRRRSLSWPPEPLRWVAGKLINATLEALDRRTDRQIRAMRR